MPSAKHLFVIFTCLLLASCDQNTAVKTPAELDIIYKDISTPSDIIALDASAVAPVAYTHVVSLADLAVADKKQKFFDLLLPAILISKHKLSATHARLQNLSQLTKDDSKLPEADQTWLANLYKKYRAASIDELLIKTLTHPNSITLAQASLETGWGTSRFFIEGNNVFGIWSFDENEPRIAANHSRDGKTVYVKRYASLIDAIDDYFLTLARNDAYKDFRTARTQSSNPLTLVKDLGNYSEIGDEYIQRLTSMINYNKLEQFDGYVLATK